MEIMRSSVKWFILVLLTNLVVATVNPVSGAGYGEDSDSLGQLVDDFIDSNNVSVAVEVVRNATYNAMELNFTSGIPSLEDFQTYTEVDVDGDITITETRIEWDTMRRDADSYVWKDFIGDYFGDFEFRFGLNMSDVEAGDATGATIVCLMMMANITGEGETLLAGEALVIYIAQNLAVDDTFRLRIAERNGGVNVFVSGYGLNFPVNDALYLTFNRSGNDVGLYIYNDTGRTNLVQTWEEVGQGKTYRYLEPMCSHGKDTDGADHSTGYIENLDFGEVKSGYTLEGYFTTTDYLDYVNGSTLALMTISRIFPNTFITVQISDDNATWGDAEGIPGDSHDLLGGLETIELRPFNGSTSYLMFNLSTTDVAITPYLNQSRLITTEGPIVAGEGVNWLPIALILGLAMVLLGSKVKG